VDKLSKEPVVLEETYAVQKEGEAYELIREFNSLGRKRNGVRDEEAILSFPNQPEDPMELRAAAQKAISAFKGR
jgi:hypothetical protein